MTLPVFLLLNNFFILTSTTQSMVILIIIGVALIGIGIFLIFYRKKFQNTITEMKYIQTSPVKNIQENYQKISGELGKGNYSEYVELKGISKSKHPLKSQHTNSDCVWYRSTVVREYEEEHYETDSKGNRQKVTRRGSENVSTVENGTPFELDDGTGSIKINTSGAEIVSKQIYNQFKPGEYNGSIKINLGGILGGSSGRRTLGYRYVEDVIPLEQNLYILGEASDKDGSLEIKSPGDKKKKFIVSVKSEEELIKSYSTSAAIMLVAGIILPLLGIGAIIFAILKK